MILCDRLVNLRLREIHQRSNCPFGSLVCQRPCPPRLFQATAAKSPPSELRAAPTCARQLRRRVVEALRLADESSRFSVDSPRRRHAASIPGLESATVKPDSPRLELESSLRMRESPELGLESPKLGRASSRFTRDALKFDGESELRARVPESRH